jgi:hypothetical protein
MPNNRAEKKSLEDMHRKVTLSKLPYHKPVLDEREEYYDRRSEPDRLDEMAIRADFVNSNPEPETVRRRAVYRKHLDFKCLPEDQNFVVMTTYGPTEEFDVLAPKVGFRIWGVFDSEKEAVMHIQFVREVNPHAVFLPMHIIHLGRAIDLPPPNDGSVSEHQLNKEYESFMKKHLARAARSATKVHERKLEAITSTKRRNEVVQEFNNIQKSLQDISKFQRGMYDDNDTEEVEKLVSKLGKYKGGRDPELKSVTPGHLPFDECLKDLKCIPPQLFDS